MKQKLFFLLLCLFSFSAKSQNLEDETLKTIKSLRAKGVDTIVQFDGEYIHTFDQCKIEGLGEILLIQETYLFYKLKGVGMVAKCIHYGDMNGVDSHEATLNPIKVNCDSLFKYVAANLAKYEEERIYPFIYKWRHDGDSSYVYLYGSHPSDVSLTIDVATEYYRKNLRLDDVDESGLKGEVKNLNYAYNSNTAIYQIYLLVQNLVNPIQRKFTYGSNNRN